MGRERGRGEAEDEDAVVVREADGAGWDDVGVAYSAVTATLRGSMMTSLAEMTWPGKPTKERRTWRLDALA